MTKMTASYHGDVVNAMAVPAMYPSVLPELLTGKCPSQDLVCATAR